MINNKGQTLVLFVMLLPLFFILFALVVDIGFIMNEKNKIETIVRNSISNSMKCSECTNEEIRARITDVINKNINNIEIEKINVIKDNQITIRVSKKVKGLFSNIINTKYHNVTISYIAETKNDKVIFKKE